MPIIPVEKARIALEKALIPIESVIIPKGKAMILIGRALIPIRKAITPIEKVLLNLFPQQEAPQLLASHSAEATTGGSVSSSSSSSQGIRACRHLAQASGDRPPRLRTLTMSLTCGPLAQALARVPRQSSQEPPR